MKKLYMLAAAALTTLSMSAQVYVVGNGNLSWDLPGQAVPANADGSYTLNVNCDQFKVSRNNSTAWDGEGSFNAGAITATGNSFSDAVFSSNGETLNCETNGENISLPAMGSYTITISSDFSKMTAKANFTKPTEAPSVYVRGDMNGWAGSPEAWKFSYDASSDTYSLSCTINAGVKFKIADSSWGNINYGGTVSQFDTNVDLAYNGSDIVLTAPFTGTIIFKITGTKQAYANFSTGGSTPTPTYPDKFYVIGNVNGATWAPNNGFAMTKSEEGVFTAKVAIGDEMGTGNGYFSFTDALATGDSEDDWKNMGTRYGSAVQNDCEPSFTEANKLTYGEYSFVVPQGTYNMTVSLKDMTLMITADGNGGGGGNTPSEPVDAAKIYVLGAGTGLGWDFPGMAVEKGTDGKFTFSVDNLVKFKISTKEASDWDTYNEGAYSTGATTFGAEVYGANGQTLPIEPWGEDQMVPWAGNYTITVDLTAMTMTAKTTTPEPVGPAELYIRGDVNGWNNLSDEWKFNYNETSGEYIWKGSIPADSKFKIADADWGKYNFGNGDLFIDLAEDNQVVMVNNGNDMALSADFTGTVTLELNPQGAIATFEKSESGVCGVEAEEGSAVYYNLQGVKVDNPERGIFVKVTNGKAVKVVK